MRKIHILAPPGVKVKACLPEHLLTGLFPATMGLALAQQDCLSRCLALMNSASPVWLPAIALKYKFTTLPELNPCRKLIPNQL
jgi:hypothetical protein